MYVLSSPFFPYLAVTAALNIPPAIWGLQSLQCGDEASWLWINGALCVVNVIASFYIVNKIQQEVKEQITEAQVVGDVEGAGSTEKAASVNASTTSTTSNAKYQNMDQTSTKQEPAFKAEIFNMATNAFIQATPARYVMKDRGTTTAGAATTEDSPEGGHPNTMKRMSKVLCYDAGVAIYILFALGWLLWQTIGVSKAFVDNDEEGEQGVCDTQQWIFLSLTCAVMYASLVCVVFACSLLCLR